MIVGAHGRWRIDSYLSPELATSHLVVIRVPSFRLSRDFGARRCGGPPSTSAGSTCPGCGSRPRMASRFLACESLLERDWKLRRRAAGRPREIAG